LDNIELDNGSPRNPFLSKDLSWDVNKKSPSSINEDFPLNYAKAENLIPTTMSRRM